jgi:hypothetical protein
LSELKNLVKLIRILDCNEGTVRNRRRFSDDETPLQKTTIIDVVRRDNLVKFLETKIETLQDELDSHNATKTI